MKVINFMGLRRMAALFSIVLVLASIGSLAVQQLNWGLDFTGGTLVEVAYSETVGFLHKPAESEGPVIIG